MTGTDAIGTDAIGTGAIVFEPPGPGSWMLDTTHHGRRPLSGYLAPAYHQAFVDGMPQMFERYGLPVDRARAEYVEGCSYVRIMGVGEPEAPKGGPPPAIVFKVLSRVHPALRRRTRTAARAWVERRWRSDVDQWFDHDREPTIAELLRLGKVDPGELDDHGVLEHLREVTAHFERLAERGFADHGGDLVPVGDYIAHCRRWGIDDGEAASLLAGASPASTETADLLAPAVEAIAAADHTPTDLAEIRALGPDADAAVELWLELHGDRLLLSDDLDSPTLNELPDVQYRAVLAGGARRPDAPVPDAVRGRVPAADRALFDELLGEARYGLRLRDDNVGVRWNWPVGLIRRALLDVGSRLVDRGRATAATDALELAIDEVEPLLLHGVGPTAAELASRAARRLAVEAAGPPLALGPPDSPPPVDAFPPALARAANAILAMIDVMQGVPGSPLTGVGVGTSSYRGRACVLRDAAEAIDRLQAGDVVVAPFTGPAWNSLLSLVGAFVVEEGGAMCHAAIVAREFGVPAVVGVAGATSQIPDGAVVEVDPLAGSVRMVS